jgi:hypothetical protein
VGLVGSDAVASVTQTASGTGVTSSGVAQAGSFTATPSAAVMSGNVLASNYSFSYVPATNTVNQAPLSVSAVASLSGNIYSGAQQSGSYTSTALGSDSFTVTGLASGTHAGTYTSALTVSGAALGNYSTPSVTNANFVISPKPVTLSNTASTTTYDGVSSYQTLANANAFVPVGLVGSDAVASVTQTASGTGVTSSGVAQAGSFTVTPSAAVMGTGLASNYDFGYVASSNTVNPANLRLTAVGLSKAFDGTTASSTAPSVIGLLGSDSISALAQAFVDANVGTGKRLAVKPGYVIADGNGGNNYNVTLVADTTGVITAPASPATPASRAASASPAVVVLAPIRQESSITTAPPVLTTLTTASATMGSLPTPAPAPAVASTAAPSAAPSTASSAPVASAGVRVNTINAPSLQSPGLVTVLVPRMTASASSGLVITLPESVTSFAGGVGQPVSVSLPGQLPLPEWIRYNADTRTLIMGTVPANALPLSVVVTVGGQTTVIQISEDQTNF